MSSHLFDFVLISKCSLNVSSVDGHNSTNFSQSAKVGIDYLQSRIGTKFIDYVCLL